MIWVKCIGIDERTGKVRLSRKSRHEGTRSAKNRPARSPSPEKSLTFPFKAGGRRPSGFFFAPGVRALRRSPQCALLLTNDDGIDSVFLLELARELVAEGQVTFR